MARNLVHMSCCECCVICIKILNAPKYPEIQLFTNIILQFLDTVLYLVKIKGDKSDQLVTEIILKNFSTCGCNATCILKYMTKIQKKIDF